MFIILSVLKKTNNFNIVLIYQNYVINLGIKLNIFLEPSSERPGAIDMQTIRRETFKVLKYEIHKRISHNPTTVVVETST